MGDEGVKCINAQHDITVDCPADRTCMKPIRSAVAAAGAESHLHQC